MLRKGNTTLLLFLFLVIGGGIWAVQQGVIELPEADSTSDGGSCDYACLSRSECNSFGGDPVSGSCDTGICCNVDDDSDSSNDCEYQCTGGTECTGLGGTVTDGTCSGGSVCCNFN